MEASTILILAGVVAACGVGVLAFVLFRGETKRPGTPVEWLAMGASIMLLSCASIMMILGMALNRDGAPVRYVQEESLGAPAPNISFTRLSDNQETDLFAYKGKVVLLNFWATWCPPCLEEMPDLNRLQAEYRDQGLVILTLSDETPAELATFDEVVPLDTEPGLIANPESLPMPYVKMLDGRPESYVIDRDGVLREFVLGARNYTYFKEIIRPYL